MNESITFNKVYELFIRWCMERRTTNIEIWFHRIASGFLGLMALLMILKG